MTHLDILKAAVSALDRVKQSARDCAATYHREPSLQKYFDDAAHAFDALSAVLDSELQAVEELRGKLRSDAAARVAAAGAANDHAAIVEKVACDELTVTGTGWQAVEVKS